MVRHGQNRFAGAGRRWLVRRDGGDGAYRGGDRRGVVSDSSRSAGRWYVTAAASMALVILLVLAGPTWSGDTGGESGELLVAQLHAGALAMALLLGGLCLLWWRLVSEAPVLWLGAASVTYGLGALGAGHVEAITVATGNDMLLWLHPASRLVVAAMILRALLAPEIDAALRPLRVATVAVVATAIVTVGLPWLGSFAQFAATPSDAVATGGGLGRSSSLDAAMWAVAAIWSVWLGLRRHRHIFAWFALLLFALAFAEAVPLLAEPRLVVGEAGQAALRSAGLLCAILGVTIELARAYARQGSRLLEVEQSAEARMEAERATQAERAHEATNALSAIEGATRTLERYQDQLDPATRAKLADAVSTEVHRLQQIISETSPRVPPAPGRFLLTEALAAVVTSSRSQGLDVTLDVPEHLVAIGQPAETAQVLQNLFQNARRYGRGRLWIRACLEGEEVVVRVKDDGPGIPTHERETIFSRGVRGSAAASQPGSGLGLYISAQLMRQQGGDLRLEEAQGGACFAMTLPGFSELTTEQRALQQLLDQGDEAAQSVVAEHAIPLLPRQRQARARRIQQQDGVRDDVAR